jgi:hypothetical protein
MKRFLMVAAILALSVGTVLPASAAAITFTAPMTGFSYNSDSQSAAFNAALGSGYTHISFRGAASSDGASYSPDVTFSTKVGASGGSNTNLVNAGGEIGPYDAWIGTLDIDFLARGYSVSAVGFGLVVFNNPANTIRVYDELNTLVGTYNNPTANDFSLWGIGGERIGRIELDGNFFAIQDIEFSAPQPVPEPASLLLLGTGLVGLRAWKKRKA